MILLDSPIESAIFAMQRGKNRAIPAIGSSFLKPRTIRSTVAPGFEQAGFFVVREPDTVFGQRIEDFHAPAALRFMCIVRDKTP
jgi:hypothetical protein